MATTLLASPRNLDSPENENTFVDELPWLVEIQASKSSLVPEKSVKRAKPKIARTFPWTFDTQHDANVLKRKKQTSSAKALPDLSLTGEAPEAGGMPIMTPNKVHKMREELRLLKAKHLNRSYSTSTIL